MNELLTFLWCISIECDVAVKVLVHDELPQIHRQTPAIPYEDDDETYSVIDISDTCASSEAGKTNKGDAGGNSRKISGKGKSKQIGATLALI